MIGHGDTVVPNEKAAELLKDLTNRMSRKLEEENRKTFTVPWKQGINLNTYLCCCDLAIHFSAYLL